MDSSCLMFPDHSEYCVTLVYCKRLSSMLSTLGCIFTITIIWIFKSIQRSHTEDDYPFKPRIVIVVDKLYNW